MPHQLISYFSATRAVPVPFTIGRGTDCRMLTPASTIGGQVTWGPEADMTFRDDEIAFPGNREIIERELSKSVAQVLHLVPGRLAGHRSLQEIGVDIVLSVAFVRADRNTAASFAADVVDACTGGTATPRVVTPDGVAPDIADDYARAKAEVNAILRRDLPAEVTSEIMREVTPEVVREIR
jgi:hypothetical protein